MPLMAYVATSVTVTTTAVQISASSDSDHVSGHSLQFTTPASPAMFVGPSGVTNGNGYPLAVSTEYFFNITPGDDLFIVAASGSTAVPVLRGGV
jgi:hypothetical protein